MNVRYEMGRLTNEHGSKCRVCIDSIRCDDKIKCIDERIYQKLKHYEDLEEAGRLIKLPCAVGDTVWCTDREDDGKGAVTCTIHSEPFACLVKDLWGIKFFATKEEAERKLAELEGDRK